jgi:hypothetical protein
VHRLDYCRWQGLGDIANAAADDAGRKLRMGFAVSFHATGDLRKKVTCLEFEEVGIDSSHDGAGFSRRPPTTQGQSKTQNIKPELHLPLHLKNCLLLYNFPDKLYDFSCRLGWPWLLVNHEQ